MNFSFHNTALFCVYVLLCFNLSAQIQNQTINWCYAYNAIGGGGLSFSTTPPSVLSGAPYLNTNKGGSLSDLAGNLLFYSKGREVYNKQYMLMANGTGLAGGATVIGAASGLSVKQPGNDAYYYVFTLDPLGSAVDNNNLTTGGLYYSIIDMSLAAGNGSVTTKNVPLLSPAGNGIEMLAASRHCNANDVWILTHENNSNNFLAYSLTSTGINTVPVSSSAGPAYSYTPGVGANTPVSQTYGGLIKISPWGNKIVCLSPPNSNVALPYLCLYDFDNATGVVSNPVDLTSQNPYEPYGFEFSSDGSKLYAAVIDSADTQNFSNYFRVRQWDLCAGSASAIVNSANNVYAPPTGMWMRDMQLAMDNKIYISASSSTSQMNSSFLFHIINEPDNYGVSCNYSIAPQYMGFMASFPFPAWDSYLLRPNYTYTAETSCSTVEFTRPKPPPCISKYMPVSYLWLFGDPASGVRNTSTLTNPKHTFSTGGDYTVKVVVSYNSCAADTFIKVVTASTPMLNAMSILSSTSFSVCSNVATTLQVTGANSYTWNTGTVSSTVIVAPPTTSVYTVAGSYTDNACVSYKEATVNVLPPPILSVLGNFSVCLGNTVTLSANGAITYTWSNGMQTPSIVVSPVNNMQYYVTGTGQNNCVGNSAAVTVSIIPPPTLNVTGTFTLCSPQIQTLTVEGAYYYYWHWGTAAWATSSFIIINPDITTQYTLSGTDENGCTSSKVITVSIGCVGIQELNVESGKLRVYPNPVGEILNVEFENANAEIKISDVLSNEIQNEEFKMKNGKAEINVSELKSGIYFIKVGNEIKKFVKE